MDNNKTVDSILDRLSNAVLRFAKTANNFRLTLSDDQKSLEIQELSRHGVYGSRPFWQTSDDSQETINVIAKIAKDNNLEPNNFGHIYFYQEMKHALKRIREAEKKEKFSEILNNL